MNHPAKVHCDTAAESRLLELELSTAILVDALIFGKDNVNACNENDPATMKGSLLPGKTIRRLRDRLHAKGWQRETAGNVQWAVNAAATLKVGVVRGDRLTGDRSPTVSPQSKSVRGKTWYEQLRGQGHPTDGVLSGLPALMPELALAPGTTVWALLYRAEATTIHAELSCPYPLPRPGTRLSAWRERIILPKVT